MKVHLYIALAAAALTACGGDPDGQGLSGPPSAGALGRLNISPECGALGQACVAFGLDAPLARGARLDLVLDLRLNGSSGPPVTLRAATPEIVAAEGTRVLGAGEGAAAILVAGPGGQVLDFLHLWVREADELRPVRTTEAGATVGPIRAHATLVVGEDLLLHFEAFGQGQPLLGQFPIEWTVEGDAAQIVEDTLVGRYRLIARAAGAARVAAYAPTLGLEAALTLEVLP